MNGLNNKNDTNNMKDRTGKRRARTGLLREVLKGTLPGMLLCIAVAGLLDDNVATAGSETFLPSREITLSGTVTAPSCQVKLEDDRLTFARQTAGKETGGQVQTLRLRLSECDADGVGMMFTATHWPDAPERGRLQEKNGGAYATQWYYTISPQDSQKDAWPLTLAPDSPAPLRGTGGKMQEEQTYFSLDKVNYWYDMKTPLKAGDVMVIPLAVTVRHDDTQRAEKAEDELEAYFTLQLSWR